MPRKPRRPPVSRDKRFKKRSLLPDSGPPERWQHSGKGIEFTNAAGIFAARAMHEHVLDKLFAMRMISGGEHEAGLKFHGAYHAAKIEDKISASLSPMRGHGGDPQRRYERSERQEKAYQQWRRALAACGADARDTLIHVACVGHWPSLEQLPKMKEGLGQLARHYELKA